MRIRPLPFMIGLAVFSSCSAGDRLAAQTLGEAVAQTRRDLEIAKLELRLYRQVEYPRERRRLDADVKLATMAVKVLKARVREYRRFDRFPYSRPLFVSMQTAELRLLETELRLKDLVEERGVLIRFRGDRCRLYELKVVAIRARLVALERRRMGG